MGTEAPKLDVNWYAPNQRTDRTGDDYAAIVGTRAENLELKANKLRPISSPPRLTPGMSQTALSQKTGTINAVITDLTPTTVTVSCHLKDKSVDLDLPTAIIPEDLRTLGQPLLLSLDRSAGFRRLLVENREIEKRTIRQIDPEIADWLES